MQAYKVKPGYIFVDATTGTLHHDVIVAPEMNARQLKAQPNIEAQIGVNTNALICFAAEGSRVPASLIVKDMDRQNLTAAQVENVATAYFEFSGGRSLSAALRPSPAARHEAPTHTHK